MILEDINKLLEEPLNNAMLNIILALLWLAITVVEINSNMSSWYILCNGFFIGINTYIAIKELIEWNIKRQETKQTNK